MTIEIDPLFDDNTLTLSMSKARFEEVNMDHFQNSTCRPEKYHRDTFLFVVTHIMAEPIEHITVPAEDLHDVR